MVNVPEEYAFLVLSTSVISILIESFFVYFLFKKTKKIDSSKLLLFIGIVASFIVSGLIISFNYYFQIYHYIVFNIFCFILAKLLYKKAINMLDFILIGYLGVLLTVLVIPVVFIKEYILNYSLVMDHMIGFFASRLLILIAIFIVSKLDLNKLYNKFINLWDRRDDGRIKAITIRNSVLIILNATLYAASVITTKVILS